MSAPESIVLSLKTPRAQEHDFRIRLRASTTTSTLKKKNTNIGFKFVTTVVYIIRRSPISNLNKKICRSQYRGRDNNSNDLK